MLRYSLEGHRRVRFQAKVMISDAVRRDERGKPRRARAAVAPAARRAMST